MLCSSAKMQMNGLKKRFAYLFISFAHLSLCIMLLTASQGQIAMAAPSNAKDMFYQEIKDNSQSDTPPAESSGITGAYSLELHREGVPIVLCNNRFPFQSGDGVRVHLKTSAPAYCYIALIGSTGKRALLYPPAGSTEDNRLEAGKEYIVPPKGLIVFDNNPGTEDLIVILSRQPLNNEKALG
ncbi:MAG: DUF4384 domain-containing protein, partial [Cyanobacteria bacterium]|nr:DUF4384 domain-containing protein [Cyanobacteriota bacterium]